MKKILCTILAVILIVCSLGGCTITIPDFGSGDESSSTTTSSPAGTTTSSESDNDITSSEIPTVSSEPTSSTMPEIDMDNIVYNIISEDFVSEGENISYRVPQINLKSSDAITINNEIMDKYGSLAKEMLQYHKDGEGVYFYYIKWQMIKHSEYCFALIVSKCNPDSSVNYSVYNFDAKNGKIISNKKLLDAVRQSEDEFIALTKAAAKKVYDDKYLDIVGETHPMYIDMLEYTLSDERINIDMPMYINSHGGISVVASIGSLAGATSYYHLVDVT